MKYEKIKKEGTDKPWIRITVNENHVVEREMVEADEELFKQQDSAEAPSAPVPAGDEPPADNPPEDETEPTRKRRR